MTTSCLLPIWSSLLHRPFLCPLSLSLSLSPYLPLFLWWVVMKQQQQLRRKAPMESSPSSSSYPGGEQVRARWKHQSLLQDYNELLKETEAKKIKLQKTIERKHKLLGEVKFLRKKYKSFSEQPPQDTRFRLKKKSHNIQSPVVRVAPPPNPVNQSELPVKDRRVKETAAPSPSTRLLDLNQVSMPSFEEMQEYQMEWEPMEVEKLNRHPAEEETAVAAIDLKLSIFRDIGSNVNSVGKRKISWQDPVALRV